MFSLFEFSILLISHPKPRNSGTPYYVYNPGKWLVHWLSRAFFLSLAPLKKYYSHTSDQEDLISIGTIGLIKGISTFDPSKGARLATYAARCVENEILMYFRSQRKSSSDVSLSEYIETGKDGNSLSLMDVICAEDDLFDNLSARETYTRLYQAIERVLTPREREILTLRYGLGGRVPRTQREIAAQLGISRSYVSRIEKKALNRLEAEFRRGEV